MQQYFGSLIANSIFMLTVAVFSGLCLGAVKFGGVSLGTSGALFTGLLMGWLGVKVPTVFFMWNLLIFVTAVGLLSSKDIVSVIKRYGFRFVILSVSVTAAGALATYLMALAFSGTVEPLLVGGTYTGALTSSPGLGAALEISGGDPLITIGYTIAYPFGVISVVLFVQLVPVLFKVDFAREKELLASEIDRGSTGDRGETSSVPFTLASFVLCMIGGVIFGSISVPLPFVGAFSLGSTGGALIFALFAGARGRIGPFPMRLDTSVLSALRTFSLAYFLAVMGIQAGPDIPRILAEHGVALLLIGGVSAVVSLLVGLIVGRWIFRINWIVFLGAIPGAMTSTPGLGAAIEATGYDESSAGYGATYPAAIFCMVLFTKLIIQALQ